VADFEDLDILGSKQPRQPSPIGAAALDADSLHLAELT